MYIYKIHKEGDNNCYVGSTVNLKNRIKYHKQCCCNEKGDKYNLPIYKYIRENGGWDKWIVAVLECVEDCDRYTLFELEQKWIDEIKPSLNCRKAPTGLSREEYRKQYRKENIEHIKEHDKQRYQKNKEQIKEYRKEKHTCPCGGKYITAHRARHLKTKRHQTYIKSIIEK